jgi:3-oxoacyl-[acyl-carrier-protein] synthase II
MNSDASDFVLPNADRQVQCMHAALDRAGITPADIDIVSTHATGTLEGDVQECVALARVFHASARTRLNNAKSLIGHAMGAAGALELAGNLPAFHDRVCHATINVDELDSRCDVAGLVLNEPQEMKSVQYIMNNSFGMLGINSVVIMKRV